MKLISTAWIVMGTFIFVSCKKHDNFPEPPKKDSTCNLMQSLLFRDSLSGDEPGRFSQFRKEYDGSGSVNKVVAGLFTLHLEDSVSLLLKYNGTTVYFIDENHLNDTFTIATFDAQHRLLAMTNGNVDESIKGFSTTEFYYDANRLSGFKIVYAGSITRLTYDGAGNVIRMYDDSDTESGGTFFTYDLSVTAKRQFYSDHFINGGENSLYLAQFLGWLPDLEPVNKRTSWKIVFDDPADNDPPYVFLEGSNSDHVYDSNGNLVSYHDGSDTYTNVWSCGAAKN